MTTSLKSWLLAVVCVTGLAGCGCTNESVSYDLSASNTMVDNQSMTLIRDRPYLWSSTYKQTVVIANMPECQRRYAMLDGELSPYHVKIYEQSGSEHLWVFVGQGQYYLFDHVDCKFRNSVPGKDNAAQNEASIRTPIPFDENDLIGEFVEDAKGNLIFVNTRTQQQEAATGHGIALPSL